jgi:transposase
MPVRYLVRQIGDTIGPYESLGWGAIFGPLFGDPRRKRFTFFRHRGIPLESLSTLADSPVDRCFALPPFLCPEDRSRRPCPLLMETAMVASKSPAKMKARASSAGAETPLTAPSTKRAQKVLKKACQPPPVLPVVNGPEQATTPTLAGASQAAPPTISSATGSCCRPGQQRQNRRAKEAQRQHKVRQQQQRKRQALQAQRVAQQAQDEIAAQEKLATMPIVNAYAAGIDIGDATHWVCVEETPDGAPRVREFSAMTHGLREIIAWLRQCGVTTVALEATGVYSHILFLMLLEEGFEAKLVPPQFTKQIKGRPKTDKRDCQWIQRLHRLGFLPAAFQPDEATQTLRDYVRQRSNHVRLSSHHILRMQKALQLMNLKLTKVLGDITGVTGLRIIRSILKGTRDPVQLAQLRDRRCKHSEEEIAQALDGRYRPEHLLELELCLHMWEQYQKTIGQLDRTIQDQLLRMRADRMLPPLSPAVRKRGRKPHDPAFDVRTALYYLSGVDLTAIEGISEVNALVILSEIGTDLSRWPTVKHFCSWLGLCPNWKKTGGKVRSSQTRRGKNRAAAAFRLAAYTLIRSHGYLGAYMRRQRTRLGAPKAITAAAHKLARIVYNLLRYGIAYLQKTEEEYAAQVRARRLKSLRRHARELGFRLEEITEPSACPAPVAEEAATPVAAS